MYHIMYLRLYTEEQHSSTSLVAYRFVCRLGILAVIVSSIVVLYLLNVSYVWEKYAYYNALF